jgi:hypothetical protein
VPVAEPAAAKFAGALSSTPGDDEVRIAKRLLHDKLASRGPFSGPTHYPDISSGPLCRLRLHRGLNYEAMDSPRFALPPAYGLWNGPRDCAMAQPPNSGVRKTRSRGRRTSLCFAVMAPLIC